MTDEDKADIIRNALKARRYSTWLAPSLACTTCGGEVEYTNVATETGKISDIVFTPSSVIRCRKCRKILDAHPLATLRGETPAPQPEPEPAPIPKLPQTPKLSGTFRALCTRVIDGDTLEALVALPFSIFTKQTIRLNNYDAPESHEPDGHAATTAAELLCAGAYVTLLCYPVEDKYGRIVADVQLPDGRDLAKTMRQLGHKKEQAP